MPRARKRLALTLTDGRRFFTSPSANLADIRRVATPGALVAPTVNSMAFLIEVTPA